MFERHKEKVAEKKIQKIEAEQCKYNKISKTTNVIFNTILAILSLFSIIPFIFVMIISFTDENTLAMNGYPHTIKRRN